MSRALALLAMACAALTACHPGSGAAPRAPGAATDARAYIATIAVCTTTESDLRAQLGAPSRDGRLAAGRIVSWVISGDDIIAYLAVLLDAHGTVVDLYWDIPTEIPWTPTDHCPPRS